MSGPTNREETRKLALSLTGADCLILAAVTAFVTSVPLWSRPYLDAPILFLWSSLPVMASRVPRQNKKWRRSLIILALALGGILGWQFIKLRVPTEHAMGWELQTALLVFWSSGFLIVQPLTYRLFDALALGALAIGILEGRAWTAALVGLALLGWFVALSFRHRLFDLSSAHLPARPMASATAGFFVASVAMVICYGSATTFLGSEDLMRGRNNDVVANRRRIGWGDGPVLSNLQEATRSEEPFFRVEVRNTANDQILPLSRGRIAGFNWLWRMLVNDNFKDDLGNWEERPTPGRSTGGLNLNPRFFASPWTLSLERVSSNVDIFPTTYGTREARLVSSDLPGARLVADSRAVLSIVDGRGRSFSQGDQIDLGLDGQSTPNDIPSEMHRELPRDERILARLRQITSRLNRRGSSQSAKIRSLEAFYHSYFDYKLAATWPLQYDSQEDKLLGFLNEHFSGDCNYFALSSCLLLRSMGISARMVRGFLGLSWDPDLKAWTVVEGSAHRWTEYWDGKSWQVFDGTQFTRNNAGPAGQIREGNESAPGDEDGDVALVETQNQRNIWTRLTLPSEEDSRSAMLFFLCPILAVLLVVVLKKPDNRSRPKRSEINSTTAASVDLPELSLQIAHSERDPRQRTFGLYVQWQRKLARFGRQRRISETPRQHAQRLSHDYPDMSVDSKEIADLMDRACYSQKDLDESRLEDLEKKFRS